MGGLFGKTRGAALSTAVVLLAAMLLATPGASQAASDTIKWNVSLFGAPRGWTYPLERWAKAMEKETSGKWKIKLHYGGVLSPPKQQLDGLKGGVFEACQFCSAYTPAKLPLHAVMELPFISPKEPAQITAMVAAMWKHPALLKELRRWRAVPLLPGSLCTYNLMGKKKIAKVEDFDGVRIRIGGNIAKVLKEFGAVPTLIPAPEVYEAIDRGTLDLVGFPWSFAFGAFKIDEVSKYAIVDMNLGTMACAFLANQNAWKALPEEFKKIHKKWYDKSVQEWGGEYDTLNQKWTKKFKKRLEFVNFPPGERAKLVNKAKAVWEKWAADAEKKGLPGKEVLAYYLKSRKEICGY
ncbi:MAG: C4-dicarboxylate TRAP transporter substrate-binding protein [Desulfarculaceae bacterium]